MCMAFVAVVAPFCLWGILLLGIRSRNRYLHGIVTETLSIMSSYQAFVAFTVSLTILAVSTIGFLLIFAFAEEISSKPAPVLATEVYILKDCDGVYVTKEIEDSTATYRFFVSGATTTPMVLKGSDVQVQYSSEIKYPHVVVRHYGPKYALTKFFSASYRTMDSVYYLRNYKNLFIIKEE